MFALNSQLEEHLRLHNNDLTDESDEEENDTSLPITENENSGLLSESLTQKNSERRSTSTYENDDNDSLNSNSNGQITNSTAVMTPRNGDDNNVDIVRHNSQCHECRIQLSAILGSVHAPPFHSFHTRIPCCNTTTNHNNITNNDGNYVFQNINEQDLTDDAIDIVIDFAKVHANLLVLLQKAMERISIGTSLKLGLGPTSGCVDRVELSVLGRRQRQQQQQQHRRHHRQPSLSLHNARVVIGDTMIQLWTLLNTIQRHMADNYYDHNVYREVDSDEDDDDDDGYSQNRHRPDILTLSWLKEFRKCLSVKLSKTLSCISTTRILQNLYSTACNSASTSNPSLSSMLEESIWATKESCQHITSMFAFDNGDGTTTSTNSNDNVGNDDKESSLDAAGSTSTRQKLINSSSSSFQRHRNRLYEQLDASFVALWAYEQHLKLPSTKSSDGEGTSDSATASCDGDDNGNKNGKNDSSDELKECLSHVEKMLSKAVDIHREMKEDLLGKATESGMDNSPDKAHGDSRNYEHDGPLLGSICKTEQDEKWKTKTAVFSGKGALERKRRADVPSSTSSSGLDFNDESMIPSAQNIQNHANLVNELRGRLDMIDIEVEEVEVASAADETTKAQEGFGSPPNERVDAVPMVFPEQEVSNTKPPERLSTAGLFLGATGGLLAELKDFQNLGMDNDDLTNESS